MKLNEDEEAYLAALLDDFEFKLLRGAIEVKTMIGMMKIIAQLAVFRKKSNVIDNQKKRLEFFLKDTDQYLDCLKQIVEQEEENYNDCT